MVLGEIVAAPSAFFVDKINFCFLDVSDRERVRRLRQRNMEEINQHTLSWAAWLRMHHYDPQWEQHVIKENCWNTLDFSRWDMVTNWDSLAHIITIDTTKLSIEEVAALVAQWINGELPPML